MWSLVAREDHLNSESPLFRGDDDWQLNACVNYGDRTGTYMAGYDRAVEVLVRHIVENHTDLDVLVYPIVFLARHSVELQLKELTELVAKLEGKRASPHGHPLGVLWCALRGKVIELFPNDDPAELDAIDVVVAELDRFDGRSTAFRYARNKDGAPSLDSTLLYINVRVFWEQYTRAEHLLGGILAAVGTWLESSE